MQCIYGYQLITRYRGSKRKQRIRGSQGEREEARVDVVDHIQSYQVERCTAQQEEDIQKVLGSNTS